MEVAEVFRPEYRAIEGLVECHRSEEAGGVGTESPTQFEIINDEPGDQKSNGRSEAVLVDNTLYRLAK